MLLNSKMNQPPMMNKASGHLNLKAFPLIYTKANWTYLHHIDSQIHQQQHISPWSSHHIMGSYLPNSFDPLIAQYRFIGDYKISPKSYVLDLPLSLLINCPSSINISSLLNMKERTRNSKMNM